jgi:hypothetical protein
MDAEELRQILEEGEGQRIEFKESLANLDKKAGSFCQCLRRQDIYWHN